MASRNVLASAAVLALVVLSPARAQLTNPFGTDVVGISADDAARIKGTIRTVLAQYTAGATQNWQSANGERAGVATITRIFTNNDGKRCAIVQHTFTKGPGYPYHAPMCEVAQDDWRISF